MLCWLRPGERGNCVAIDREISGVVYGIDTVPLARLIQSNKKALRKERDYGSFDVV